MLILNEDQELLLNSAREVLDAEAPVARYRALRDAGTSIDRALWDQLAELGWPAIPFSEEQGGMGWGLPEACLVLEAMGRNVALTPMLSVLMGGLLDPESGAAEGKVVALAWRETREVRPFQIATRFEGGVLHGTKKGVLDAAAADSLVVSALDGGELGLYRVSPQHIQLHPLSRIDHRDTADVVLAGAPAERIDGDLDSLTTALHRGVVGLSAEMLGLSRAALAMTIAFAKERVQFDRPIGSFQALQHRIVDCYIAVEMLNSAVLAASREPTLEHIALCKATANETAMTVVREATQIHGGIGVTDECDVGFFMKRAMVASQTLGTTRFWRDQWAVARGY